MIGFTLTKIPVPPSLNNLFANVKGERGGGRTLTDRYKTWRNAAGWVVNSQRPNPVRGPVNLTIVIEDGGSRADLDNLIKPLADLLVAHALIDGDHSAIVRRIEIEWGEVEGCFVKVVPVTVTQAVAA